MDSPERIDFIDFLISWRPPFDNRAEKSGRLVFRWPKRTLRRSTIAAALSAGRNPSTNISSGRSRRMRGAILRHRS
jgi:hypothetical protein